MDTQHMAETIGQWDRAGVSFDDMHASLMRAYGLGTEAACNVLAYELNR